MKKILISMLAILIVLASLAGCASQPGAQSPSNSAPASVSASETAAQSEESQASTSQYYTMEELGVTYPLPMDKPNIMPTKTKPEKKVRIAILGWATNPYWVGLQDTGKQVKEILENKVAGAEVDWIIVGEDFAVPKHVSAIETCIAKQYDVILTPTVDDGTCAILEQAMAKGITVGTYVCESDGMKKTNRLALFGQNVQKGGEIAGQFISDKIGGEGKVGFITGSFGVNSFEQRMNGAKAKLGEKVQIIGPYENSDQAEKSYSLTKDMLTANPDLKAVYIVSGGPHGACRAIEELGLKEKVLVVGFDATTENIEYLNKGIMSAAIADSAFAQLFDLAMASYNFRVTGEKPASSEMWTTMFAITPENVKEYTGK
jgi:ribose transport system substrate-binding protein